MQYNLTVVDSALKKPANAKLRRNTLQKFKAQPDPAPNTTSTMSHQSEYPSAPSNPPTAPPSSDAISHSEKETETTPKNPNATTTKDEQPNQTPTPRLTALEARKAHLTQTLTELKARRQTLATQAKLPSGLSLPTSTPSSGEPLTEDEILASALKSSNAVIKEHIALLHRYNEIKDIGQGLMGLIADQRDCRVVNVMEEFGVGEGD